MADPTRRRFTITSQPVQGTSKNGNAYWRWAVLDLTDGPPVKLDIYYFGSESKLPRFERLKTYEIDVLKFGSNYSVARDSDGPRHITEVDPIRHDIAGDDDAPLVSADSCLRRHTGEYCPRGRCEDCDMERDIEGHVESPPSGQRSRISRSRIRELSSAIVKRQLHAQDEATDTMRQMPTPPLTEEEVAERIRLHNRVLDMLLQDADYAVVGGKRFLTKTGFKKLAWAFEVSDPEVEVRWISDQEVEVRATARLPNGRCSTDYASCHMSEVKGVRSRHNLLTKAITRAKNRVIANLVGFGSVSFEEAET